MKKLAFYLPLLALLHLPLAAAEAPIIAGQSPDGRFEVILTHENSEIPVASIRDSKTKVIKSSGISGGYGRNIEVLTEEFSSQALWSPDSTKVLIKTRDTKWSTGVTLWQLSDGQFVEQKLIDLYPAVLKDIGTASIYRRAFTSPLRWLNGSILVLKLEGDCDLPGLKAEESRRWFEYEATIDLSNKEWPSIKRLALKDHNG